MCSQIMCSKPQSKQQSHIPPTEPERQVCCVCNEELWGALALYLSTYEGKERVIQMLLKQQCV